MRSAVRVLALLSALLVAPAQAAKPVDVEVLREFIRVERVRQQVPGVAVAVVRGGDVLLAEGFGEADVEHHVPVGTQTIFQSGSVGKQFTAVALMLQVEDGKLALDDPLTRFFPEAPAYWRAITVRHLLTHTSGIPDYTDGLIDLRRDYTEDEMLRFAYGLQPEFAPGTDWRYSNTGYALLGFLIRRTSGRFYGDELAERVFRPLGMRTARIISEAAIVPHRAAGYRLENGELLNQEWVAPETNTTADGALYLSLEDMLAWDRGLRAGAILRADSWKQVYTPVTLIDGSTRPYGFGRGVDLVAGAPRYHHGGRLAGLQGAHYALGRRRTHDHRARQPAGGRARAPCRRHRRTDRSGAGAGGRGRARGRSRGQRRELRRDGPLADRVRPAAGRDRAGAALRAVAARLVRAAPGRHPRAERPHPDLRPDHDHDPGQPAADDRAQSAAALRLAGKRHAITESPARVPSLPWPPAAIATY
jgi:CubicO group peptidase (beta-lactamase class C family)